MTSRDYNPFAKRESHTRTSVTLYKILTTLSWLLVLVVGIYYTFHSPNCRNHDNNHYCHTIWGQNRHYHTPFALEQVVTSIYWIVLLVLQAGYVWHLFSSNDHYVNSAANVGSHFILNNLLLFGFIMLWVRGHFWECELLNIVNFVNLIMLYFRNSTTPRFVHIPVVSGPLAWTYIAILWNGATMVDAQNLPARIVANVFIWSILGFGGFFLLAFKDYTMGFELAVLCLSLGLAQLGTRVVAFQWIFAFIIAGLLVILSLLIGVPGILGESNSVRHDGHVVSSDRERAPLLDDA